MFLQCKVQTGWPHYSLGGGGGGGGGREGGAVDMQIFLAIIWHTFSMTTCTCSGTIHDHNRENLYSPGLSPNSITCSLAHKTCTQIPKFNNSLRVFSTGESGKSVTTILKSCVDYRLTTKMPSTLTEV